MQPGLCPASPSPTPAPIDRVAAHPVASGDEPSGTTKPATADPPDAPAVKDRPYKLTGIIQGEEGSTAVINGELVQVGETIGDATVVRINATSVILDAGGRKITLRM
ncbi:MAG: hypothetical protein ACE15C_05820 [Phycisphaerae bacterium]